jgi:hypothetical protein
MTWALALLFKGLIAVAIVAAYYVVVYRGSLWLGTFIKNPRLYDWLFRERGVQRPAPGRNLRQK